MVAFIFSEYERFGASFGLQNRSQERTRGLERIADRSMHRRAVVALDTIGKLSYNNRTKTM